MFLYDLYQYKYGNKDKLYYKKEMIEFVVGTIDILLALVGIKSQQ